MKIILISDAHLFQGLAEEYDQISDFKKAMGKVKGLKPDLVVFAGDMFDYKRTPSVFLRHYEGEDVMVQIRPTLEKLGIDIFAIRGNHEKAEVLNSIDQTVKNFHYLGDEVIERDGIGIWLLDTRYEAGSEEGEKAIRGACEEAEKKKLKRKILVMHEGCVPFEPAISDEVVKLAAGTFDFVLNGHMHVWSPNYGSRRNLYLLPSMLPSRLVFGSYWFERYRWESNERTFAFESRASPFGFVVLKTEEMMPEFAPFEPKMQTTEVTLGIEGLTLEEAKQRLRAMLEEISRKGGDKIVLPEVHGESGFLPIALRGVLSEFALPMADVRINASFSAQPRREPKLEVAYSIERIEELIRKEIPAIVKETGASIDTKAVLETFGTLLDEGHLEKLPSKVETRLRTIIEPMLERARKPDFFDQNLQEILKTKIKKTGGEA